MRYGYTFLVYNSINIDILMNYFSEDGSSTHGLELEKREYLGELIERGKTF
jgi:hypothetical protein